MAAIQDRDARAAIAQMVREHTAAREKLAAAEAAIRDRERGVRAEQARTAAIAQQATAFATDPELARYVEQLAASPPPADKDSDEYVEWLAVQRSGAVIRDFMGKIAAFEQRAAAARAEAEAKAARDAAVKKDAAYIQEHMDDFRDDVIVERVKVLVQRGFTVPEAHKTALAEQVATEAKDLSALKEKRREVARARVRPEGKGGNAPTTPPKGLNAVERDQWYQDHPESRAARLRELRAGGS